MVRWLLAVFTLHFLLAAGASAFAATPPAAGANSHPAHCGATQHPATEGSQGAGADDAVADTTADTTPDTTADYGIDLPDDQEFQRPAAGAQGAHFPCPRLHSPCLASRTPSRRLRPPRA